MKRFEFYIMLVTSCLLVFVAVGQAVVIRNSQEVARQVMAAQQYVGQAQQAKPVMDKLLGRILQAAEKEPVFRDVLVRNGFQIRDKKDNSSSTPNR
jgi:hypothetical protein